MMKRILTGLVVMSLLILLACDIMPPMDSQISPSAELLDGENQEDNNDDHTNNATSKPGEETKDDTESAPIPQDSIKGYFPIYTDNRLVYVGEGNEFAYFNVYTDYATENLVQQRIDNGGSQTVRVIKISDSSIEQKLFRGEVYYRENLLSVGSSGNASSSTNDDSSEILLKTPLEIGNEWTLSDGSVRTITGVDVEVGTTHGNRKAVEVTTVGEHGTTVDYYSHGIGLVKTLYKTEDIEISSTLSEIEQDAPFVQLVNFYFPSIEDSGQLYYVSREIPYYTNDITRSILEEEYREAYIDGGEKISKVFIENTKINSLYLNIDGMVYIDLSKDYLTDMNAGAGYESAMLQCIANTFGQYYGVERVYITIDGELYSTGHIALEKGEYIEVKIENVKSVKM